MLQSSGIPSFFLYGEAPRQIDDRFLHIEDLDYRSRPSDWEIRPHAHKGLHQVFHLTAGGGEVTAEGESISLNVPCILLIPAGFVHGFVFLPETTGQVLTVADSFFRELGRREPAFSSLFGGPEQLELASKSLERRLDDDLTQLSREVIWHAPGHASAAEAHLISILVTALRLVHQQTQRELARPGPQRTLVAQFREVVERHYRSGLPVSGYAAELRTSIANLRVACTSVTGHSPQQIIHDRLMAEAKRLLLYTNMGVAEVGLALGFEDPAYFSRFFSERAGRSPRDFRRDSES
jgi:AraC family transcriptional regulator, transcriptional activator of pobA